jgi:hypothetical protein
MTEPLLPSWLCQDCRVMLEHWREGMVVIALLNRMPVLDSGKSNIHEFLTSLSYASLWWVFGALWISKTQAWWKIALVGLFEWRHILERSVAKSCNAGCNAVISSIYSSFTVSDLTIRMLDSTWLPSSSTYLLFIFWDRDDFLTSTRVLMSPSDHKFESQYFYLFDKN